MKIFIIALIVYFIYILLVSTKSLHMLQQNRYNEGGKLFKWIQKNAKECFININLVFLIIVLFYFSSSLVKYVSYFFTVIYLFLIYVFYSNKKKDNVKIPLKYTARVKRLIFTNCLFHLLVIFILYMIFKNKAITMITVYLILGIIGYLNYLVIILINFLNIPAERYVAHYYRTKAINKLNSMTNMEVIGITGSYGKTSSKNILNDILNIKYNSFKTPANYNTPYGLMITINNYLDKYNDFFVAEMGACLKGEIKELCDFVHPKYGIITSIGLAHLETFGSEEAIQRTKFELIESLPSDGIGILNADDPKQTSYNIKNDCRILWVGIDNTKKCDAYAKDIDLTYKGTKFKVVFKGLDKEYEFQTKLLGRANIYNLLAAILLGHELGISISDLQKAVKGVEPVEHRLQMKKMNDINLIDDAYNANPKGCAMAVEVLSQMPGKKIIITSGMIELADKEYFENKELGKKIAASKADEVILVGKNQTKPIQDGLQEGGFKENKTHIVNDVKEAFEVLKKLNDGNTYCLLQSDLPDIYNE